MEELKNASPTTTVVEKKIANSDFFFQESKDKSHDPTFRFTDDYLFALKSLSENMEAGAGATTVFARFKDKIVILQLTKRDSTLIHFSGDGLCCNKLKWLASDFSKRLDIPRSRNDIEDIALKPKNTLDERDCLLLLSFIAYAKILRRPANSILAKLKNLERTLKRFSSQPSALFS